MKPLSTTLAASVLLLAAVPRHPLATPRAIPVRVEAHRMSMGCLYTIVAHGGRADGLAQTLEDALDEVDRIDRLMSHYRPDSPLSRLNRNASAEAVPVDPELFGLIETALRFGAESGGAFDITVGPLMKAWGFFDGKGRLPDDRELARLRERIGYQHVILNARRRTIRFDRPGVELDLGGIAKGYAVDRVVGLLTRQGITAALISAGGSTLYALGAPPGQRGWEVTVQDPLDARVVAFKLSLKDRALSISGSSEKSFEIDGVQYIHIMDPRTARPVHGLLAVVVLADSGTMGDALDNALFVQGVDGGRALLQTHPGTEAYFLLPGTRASWTMVHLR